MKYKEFTRWCNERACDGCWGMNTAIACIEIINEIEKIPFWKREKVWKEKYQNAVVSVIVQPIEKKMKELYGGENDE